MHSTASNTRPYGVIFHNSGCIDVRNFEDISNHENIILFVKLLRTFLGKSEVCDMTLLSGALDKSLFDGITILLEISEQSGRHRYVYIGGDMVFFF